MAVWRAPWRPAKLGANHRTLADRTVEQFRALRQERAQHPRPAEAAQHLHAVIDSLLPNASDGFVEYRGEPLPW